jgi:hypothetical protein
MQLSTFCTVSVLKALADARRRTRPGAERRARPGAGPEGDRADRQSYATAARPARPFANDGDSLRPSRSNSPSFGTAP